MTSSYEDHYLTLNFKPKEFVREVVVAMSLKTDHHFSVHIVKAKDLPLTWYELILRPDKFSEHLETLAKDPAGKTFFY